MAKKNKTNLTTVSVFEDKAGKKEEVLLLVEKTKLSPKGF